MMRVSRLMRQCPAYLYEEAPFNNPLKHLKWWREVATDSGAQVLALSTTLDYLYAARHCLCSSRFSELNFSLFHHLRCVMNVSHQNLQT
jgi:hypothetical protein